MVSGKLFIVGTPIGNMEDITLRALRVLREADLIAAEDTRRTALLLSRFSLHKPLLSYHEFNEAKRTAEILQMLREGKKVALVSDAGMPTISDPGQRLIQAVVQTHGWCSGASAKRRLTAETESPALDTSAATTDTPISLEIIPGVLAITTALAATGFPAGPFLFYGFLPYKSAQRRSALSRLAPLPFTLVFFESPHRLLKSLADLKDVLGNRRAVIARELTKKFEEILRGDFESLLKMLENRTIKGEITMVVEGHSK